MNKTELQQIIEDTYSYPWKVLTDTEAIEFALYLIAQRVGGWVHQDVPLHKAVPLTKDMLIKSRKEIITIMQDHLKTKAFINALASDITMLQCHLRIALNKLKEAAPELYNEAVEVPLELLTEGNDGYICKVYNWKQVKGK